MRHRRDGIETRRRILEAACKVFAEKGFRDATHAEICHRAGTNTAAINYHFQDKETLYAEAWEVAFHRSLEAHPPDGGVPPEAPAEERLRGRVLSFVARILDPESHEFEIVQKEYAHPTGLLMEVMRESIQPIRQEMSRIVRELLGERASDRDVDLCQMSIMAQCLHIMTRERHRRMLAGARPLPGPPHYGFSADVMADHIVRFNLAGIREIRRQTEAGQTVQAE
jgi:AcrR family transcriptional regulator